MILLDTHAWIWWVSAPEHLSSRASEAIDAAVSIGVSPISAWEIATKAARGRLELDRPVDVWVTQALARPRVEVVALSPAIAVSAGLLGGAGFHGDPADRILVASARSQRCPLVTKDTRIRAWPDVETLW